ncbi:MAG: hypothetical protein WCR52_13550, partial [Bacteroidota bacterium]|uniref:hypothetical protein n=1 Tax=Runella sp. TaxID=1960881 RepID=UPI003017A742
VFFNTLKYIQKAELLISSDSVSKLFTDNGLIIHRHVEEQFDMKFLDGSAFLNHYFVKLGWLASWKALLPEDELEAFFAVLEANLNEYSSKNGELTLTVPMAFVEGKKI